ncbi:class A basic helix-loop-helix protein 9 [Dromiciops gliroides]|uniref:class A basic helix-loop-helix protein 9 n=1 Tax=Dromiciops gliroides TaxID=33562 RepID=UPI001CC37D2E|nr:class A basic helix-loop-helix protein 9 [Dromiciops gliroides]
MPRAVTRMGSQSLKEPDSSEEEMEGVFWDVRGDLGQLKDSGPSQQPSDIEGLRVRKTSRPLRSKARRIAANVRERKRILDYNQAFNALRLALKHDLSGKRLSKIATLRRAIHRIASLSMFLRSGSAARWPCSHQECRIHYGRVQEEETGWDGHPQSFQIPMDYSYGEAALPFQPHPPSPLSLKYSPETQLSSQVESQKEDPVPPNAVYHSSGSCPFGEQPPCYPKYVDNLRAPSARAIPWQLGYLRGPGPGCPQSLPLH